MKKVAKMSERELRKSVTRLRQALVAIKVNSAPHAVQWTRWTGRRHGLKFGPVSPRMRIRALHEISRQALAGEEA